MSNNQQQHDGSPSGSENRSPSAAAPIALEGESGGGAGGQLSNGSGSPPSDQHLHPSKLDQQQAATNGAHTATVSVITNITHAAFGAFGLLEQSGHSLELQVTFHPAFLAPPHSDSLCRVAILTW